MKTDSIYYSPHQVASFFSISRDTLLFYDKIGLFSPVMRRENGYRCYSAEQLNELDTILTLKDLGIPLASIKEVVARINTPSFLSLLEKEEESIRRRMDECRFSLDIVSSIRTSISRAISTEKEKLFIEENPSIPIVRSAIKNTGEECTSDESWQEAYSNLMAAADCKAIIALGSIVPLPDAQRHLGAICREVYATYAKPSEDSIPGGRYAFMYFAGSLSNLSSFYRRFLSLLEAEGLTPSGSIYEELSVSSIVTRNESEHVTRLFVRVS